MGNFQWFNDSDFWEQYAPIMFDEAHWAEVSYVADGIAHLGNFNLYNDEPSRPLLNTNPKALDLCCGIGRISGELARRGFAVTGIDITESYLRTAREDAAHENLPIEYINIDAREYKNPGYFNIAVNLYNSFGFFADPKDDLLLVRNVYESLDSGGCFMIETHGKEIAVRDFTDGEWFERAGFTVLTQYETLDSWSLMKNKWILIKDGKRVEKVFTQRLYSAAELRSLLLEAGFSAVEIFGDWNEAPYDINAVKLIVIGRKS
ncbi:MAG: class I SAM-dependent methyltransferase [Treponema sp.]|jgi:SAM-dependent methyltransferase|nr:class I SAM-dependent methyltransferase [Treponema sp.]